MPSTSRPARRRGIATHEVITWFAVISIIVGIISFAAVRIRTRTVETIASTQLVEAGELGQARALRSRRPTVTVDDFANDDWPVTTGQATNGQLAVALLDAGASAVLATVDRTGTCLTAVVPARGPVTVTVRDDLPTCDPALVVGELEAG